MSSAPSPLLTEILASLHDRFRLLNVYYEAAWTDSWCFRRCGHAHQTLIDAAKCAIPQGAGWYVVAVEYGQPRELKTAEDKIVNEFRFGPTRYVTAASVDFPPQRGQSGTT